MNLLKTFLKKKSRLPTGATITLAIIAIFLFSIYGAQAAIDYVYRDRLLPGVMIGDRSFGRLSLTDAKSKLQKSIDGIQQEGVTYCHEKKCINVNASYTAIGDPDLSYDLFSVDIDSTLSRAYKFGRNGSLIKRISDQWKLLRHKKSSTLNWKIDGEQLKEHLKTNFSDFETPAENTNFKINSDLSITFKEASEGFIIDYATALDETKSQLEQLQSPQVTLITKTEFPTITTIDTEKIEEKIKKYIKLTTIQVVYKDSSWNIAKANFLKSLNLQNRVNGVDIGMGEEQFNELLKNTKNDLERIPRDAKFEIADGRVTEFQSSQDGIEILIAPTLNQANDILQNATTSVIHFPLSISIVPSQTPNAAVNDFGINELLATGRSDFSGSPANRRHNIAIGSNSLNGLLIAPEEEFSLVAALGNIDGTTGYKEELVIKGNETIPEFGGGLCQVGTTIFRATLNSGLPITERQNHSYRVRYYEPAGTDATIYGPHPDYRFVNDTGNYILIQTHIEGDELVYELWGTPDGRVATKTDPIVYNITSPPPTKYIETLDLPVGKIRCTESAHKGADAAFDYTVAYPDGEVKENTFTSHYRAWQEVCLIGVEKLSESENETTPSETEEVEKSLN